MPYLRTVILVLTLLHGFNGNAFTQRAQRDPRVQVLVLYINNETGLRHLEGVQAAVTDRKAEKAVNIRAESYENEDDGVAKLLRALAEKKIDIVLGPTESSVFVRALSQSKKPDSNPIPVISSLVTADEKQDEKSWFFRTNVDVTKRAQAIFNVLNKRWIKSAAILYEESEFGRRAEEAFRVRVEKKWPTINYIRLPFKDVDGALKAVDEVLDKRPESVGIFAEREHILKIFELLPAQDDGSKRYEPFLFTVLDLRLIKDRVDDIYFVSVTKPRIATYTITDWAFEELKNEQIPDTVLNKLASIKNQEPLKEETFLESLEEKIGKELADQFESSLLQYGLVRSFMITDRSLKVLNSEGTPDNVLKDLAEIRNQETVGEGAFLKVLARTIGEAQTLKHKSSILKHSRQFFDDIKGLSYDTACLVLDIVKEHPERPFDHQRFREQFAAVLSGGKAPDGKATGMRFKSFENIAQLGVYHLFKQNIELIPHDQVVGWWTKLIVKIKLIFGRFGFRPFGIAVMILLISAGTTYMDIKKWYLNQTKSLWHKKPFYLLVVCNAAVVLALYIYLAETGKIQWEGFITAFLIALAPSAILKSTLFETAAGKQIGLSNIYNKVLIWINDKLMVDKYRQQKALINVIVYFNSLPFLKQRLQQLYDCARTPERRQTLKKNLEQELKSAGNQEAKRRVYARRLLSRLDWSDLVEIGCVPERYADQKKVTDPSKNVKEGVDFCLENQIGTQDLEIYIHDRLESCVEAMTKHYANKLNEEESSFERGKLYIQMRFIFLTLGQELGKENLRTIKEKIEELKRGQPKKKDEVLKKQTASKGVKVVPSDPSLAKMRKLDSHS
ncbi:MAG: ABC transporter substrate-binding protein [bacterium]